MGLGTFAGQTQPKPANPYGGLATAAMRPQTAQPHPQAPRQPMTALGGLGATPMQAPHPATAPGQPSPAAAAPQPQRMPMVGPLARRPIHTMDDMGGNGDQSPPPPQPPTPPPPGPPNTVPGTSVGIYNGPNGTVGTPPGTVGGYGGAATQPADPNYGQIGGGAAAQAGAYSNLANAAAATSGDASLADTAQTRAAIAGLGATASGTGALQGAISDQFARDTNNTIAAQSALAASTEGGGPAAAAARAAALRTGTTLNEQTQAEEQVKANAAAAAQSQYANAAAGLASADAQGKMTQEQLAQQQALAYQQLSTGVNEAQLQADSAAYANAKGQAATASNIQNTTTNAIVAGASGAASGAGSYAEKFAPQQVSPSASAGYTAPPASAPSTYYPQGTASPTASTDYRRGGLGTSAITGVSTKDAPPPPGQAPAGTIANTPPPAGPPVAPVGPNPGTGLLTNAPPTAGPSGLYGNTGYTPSQNQTDMPSGQAPEFGGTFGGANTQAALYNALADRSRASAGAAPTVANTDTNAAIGMLGQTASGGGAARTSADSQFGEALGSSIASQMGAMANTRGGAALGGAGVAGQNALMTQGGDAMTRAAQTQANMGGQAAGQYAGGAIALGTQQQQVAQQQKALAAQTGLSYDQLANQVEASQLGADTGTASAARGLQTIQAQNAAQQQANAVGLGIAGVSAASSLIAPLFY